MIKNVYGESAAMIPDDQQSVYNWGVIDERERIIKLLEQYRLETKIEADTRGQIITQSFSIDLIALIKGENK